MVRLYLVFLCLFVSMGAAQAQSVSGTVYGGGSPLADVTVTATPAGASGTISGVVRDRATGQPVVGALVFQDVKPTVGGVAPAISVTDSQGAYALSAEGGIVDVQVWADGYGVRFASGLDLNAGAVSRDILLDAVTVDELYFVTIFVSFDNLGFHPDHDEAWFDRLLYDNTPGAASVHNYFYEISRGRLRIRKGQSAWLNSSEPDLQYPHDSYMRDDLADWALPAADPYINYAAPQHDLFDNYDRDPGGDGDVDHVLVIPAGLPQSLTGAKSCDMNPVSMLNSIYDLDGMKSPVQNVIPEYAPLGNFVHEIMHAMGDNYAQDLYIGGTCDDESVDDLTTAGKWALMDVGMYNGFEEAFNDPRGSSCETFVDPCGSDPDCWINRAGAQPAQAMPWILRERWYRRHFADAVVTTTLSSGDNQTIRLYPYAGSGPETRVISVLDPSNSSANWHITLRKPLGTDRGLSNDAYEGDTGVIIDYTDRTLTGSQVLKGPVRVRDARPNTPPPGYLHFACRFQADDAAFNVGEIDSYDEGPLSVQLLQEYSDGSVEVSVSVGNSFNVASKNRHAIPIEVEEDHPHTDHVHENLPNLVADVAGTPFKASTARKNAITTQTDAYGDYQLQLNSGNWSLDFSRCGFLDASLSVEINGPLSGQDVTLTAGGDQPTSTISAPTAGTYELDGTINLDASASASASTYTWDSDLDGLISESPTDSVTLSVGTHQITLTVQHQGCIDEAQVTLSVTDTTPPSITIDTAPNSGPGPWPVVASVQDLSGLQGDPLLHYALNGGASDAVSMSASGSGYEAEIPAQAEGVITWWISAADTYGNQAQTQAYQFTVSANDLQVLVVQRDGNDAVGGVGTSQAIVNALADAGVTQVTHTFEGASLDNYDLSNYDVIFIALGGFPNGGRLSSTESDQLRDYLLASGTLYIEGGDVGYYHRTKSFWSLLGTNYEDDGHGDNDRGALIEGEPGHPIGDGLSFNYTGEDYSVESWVDNLSPVSGASTILRTRNGYDRTDIRAVSYAGSHGQRVVTSSLSLGGFVSGTSHGDYMTRLLDWLIP